MSVTLNTLVRYTRGVFFLLRRKKARLTVNCLSRKPLCEINFTRFPFFSRTENAFASDLSRSYKRHNYVIITAARRYAGLSHWRRFASSKILVFASYVIKARKMHALR